MPDPLDLPIRPRRLRLRPELRAMLQRVTLRRSDFIVPVFVTEGSGVRREVPSMPGVFQMSVDVAATWLAKRAGGGFNAYLIFGGIERGKKDPFGSVALEADNVVCRLLREVGRQQIPMAGITDLCFCEYTSHGHCGPLTADGGTVKNDETVERLVTQAVNHARAGAAIIAPSGMMDGTIGALGRGPGAGGFAGAAPPGCAGKNAPALHGPFC